MSQEEATAQAEAVSDIFDGTDESESVESTSASAPVESAKAQNPTEQPAVPPTHSQEVVSLALEMGIDQEDIDSATTPAELTRLMHYAAKSNKSPQQPAKTAPEPIKELTADDIPFEQLGLGGEEDDWENGLVASRRHEVFERQQMRKEIDELKGHIQSRQIDESTQILDAAFGKLDAATFGEGSLSVLTKNNPEFKKTPEFAKRAAVYQLAENQAGANATPAQIAAKVEEAARLLGYTKSDSPKDSPKSPQTGYNSLAQRQQEWTDGALAQPSYRETPEQPGRTKAENGVQKVLDKHGIVNPENGGVDENDFF